MSYKCIRRWARNEVGDVIEKWELNRYPPEVQDHFKLIEPEVPAKSPIIPPKQVAENLTGIIENLSTTAKYNKSANKPVIDES